MPIDALRADGIDLTGYWYNPNIHPFTEYRARRNCLQEYAKTIGLPLQVRADYGLRGRGGYLRPLRQMLGNASVRGGAHGEGGRL